MWLFTSIGFFSAVCAKADGGKGRGIDTDTIMVRARVKAHLLRLLAEYPTMGRKPEDIVESTTNDYRWRVFVPKVTWACVVAELADRTDYSNFKNEAHDQWPGDPHGYADMLHRVWSSHAGIQADANGRKVGAYSSWERPQDWNGVPEFSAFDRIYGQGALTSQVKGLKRGNARKPGKVFQPDVKVGSVGKSVQGNAAYVPGSSKFGKPGAGECVVIVKKGKTPLGVIWWPEQIGDTQTAYAEAVHAGVLPYCQDASFTTDRRDVADGLKCPVYDWRVASDLMAGLLR